MVNLLTLHEAALHLLFWSKKIDDPLDSNAFRLVVQNDKLHSDFLRLLMFLRNAIDAEILPALRKPKSKVEEKKMHEHLGVPADIRDRLPKSHDTWVTWDDLLVFAETPSSPSNASYSHSRDALARTAWLLAEKAKLTMEPSKLFEQLDELVVAREEIGMNCRLKENTLKGCAREILDAREGILSKASI